MTIAKERTDAPDAATRSSNDADAGGVPEDDRSLESSTRVMRAMARESRRAHQGERQEERPADAPESVTQAIRMSRSERRRVRATTDDVQRVAPQRTWRDGAFLGVVGLLFSAQFAFALARDGRYVAAIGLALVPSIVMFGLGVLIGRWLSAPSR